MGTCDQQTTEAILNYYVEQVPGSMMICAPAPLPCLPSLPLSRAEISLIRRITINGKNQSYGSGTGCEKEAYETN